jgi:hypothetical protein
MSVDTKSGLVNLVSRVKAYFTANGVNAGVHLGWQARYRVINQGPGQANRVVFTPGDDNGAGGKILAPRRVGQQHIGGTDSIRAIYDWDRLVLVSIWAAAPTATGDEEARESATYEVLEDLVEWTCRAVYASAHADVVMGEVRLTVPPERAYGLEARIGLSFRHPLFDVASDLVQPQQHVSKKLGNTT